MKARIVKPIDASITEDEYQFGVDTLIKEFKIPSADAKKYVSKAVSDVKKGLLPAIHFLDSPEVAEGPYIYIREIKRMILCASG